MWDGHDLSDAVTFGTADEDDLLFRRLSAQDIANDGTILPSHAPLKQWESGLSCDWAAVTSPVETVRTLPNLVLAIPVWKCLRLGLTIRYCPVVDPASANYNLAHCLLFMPPNIGGKNAQRDKRDEFLRSAASWYLKRPNCLDRATAVRRALRRRLRRLRLQFSS